MIRLLLLIGFTVLLPHRAAVEFPLLKIVWNVGQGQWVTDASESGCQHFDAGGERAPLKSIRALCRGKPNSLWLSHWDFDHMNFANRISRFDTSFCAWGWPKGQVSPRKRILQKIFPLCQVKPGAKWIFQESGGKSSNSQSRVAVVDRWLLPGDLPMKYEMLWLDRPELRRIEVLVAGHHGSRTSTSEELLQWLPRLQQVVISARRERYGHPHLELMLRLYRRGVAGISTEEWGNIGFE